MDKIYLVVYWSYEDHDIYSAWTSREKAEVALKEAMNENIAKGYEWMNTQMFIEEVVVNG